MTTINENIMKELEEMRETNPSAYRLCLVCTKLEGEIEDLKEILVKEVEEHAQDKKILDEITSKEMEEELALTVAKGLACYGYDIVKSVEMAREFVEKVKY